MDVIVVISKEFMFILNLFWFVWVGDYIFMVVFVSNLIGKNLFGIVKLVFFDLMID